MGLEDWLKLQNRKVRSNCEVISLPAAYHISLNPKIKQFIPTIGEWKAELEDRTIPRVCCSSSVHMAISGHAAVAYTIINRWTKGNVDTFSIYEFGFTEYIKPNKKLVFDAEVSQELWVVPNAPESTCFKAPVVGEFTLLKSEETWEKGANCLTLTFVGVTSKPVLITSDVYIKGGFELVLKTGGAMNEYIHDNDYTLVSVRQCSASVYSSTVNATNKNVK